MCGGHKPDYDRTEQEREQRRAWGCEEDSEYPTAVYVCPACSGLRFSRHSPTGECPHCEGIGVVVLRRCPLAIVDQHSTEIVELFGLYKRDVTTVTGGEAWHEMPSTLVDAFRYLEVLWSKYERWKAATEIERIKRESGK